MHPSAEQPRVKQAFHPHNYLRRTLSLLCSHSPLRPQLLLYAGQLLLES